MTQILPHLVYFAWFQSLFLLSIFTFSGKVRKSVNHYLLILIGVMSIGLSGRAFMYAFDGNPRLYGLTEYATFLFGATVYLFTRSSLSGEQSNLRKDFLHYVPGAIYAVVVSVYYVFAPSEVIAARIANGTFFWMVALFMGTGLVVNFTYWIAACRLFLNVTKRMQPESSFVIKTGFFQRFLIAVGMCLLCWLCIYVIGIVGESWLERSVRPFIWLALGFLILFIAYYSIKEPAVFQIVENMPVTKYAQSKLSHGELEQLEQRLDQLMKERKPYLNRKLMKADLAEMLGVNGPEIARLLNEKIGMNFFEYVNYHRIREFIAIAKSEQASHLTFFGIAQETGFNSKTTFNKSFKKIMGTSPREYFAREVG